MRSRAPWKSGLALTLEDVSVEAFGLKHSDLRPSHLYDPRSLQRRQEAADALPRGSRQLREVRLAQPNRDSVAHLRRVGLLGQQLVENAGDPARHRLEGLAREPPVRLTQAPGER